MRFKTFALTLALILFNGIMYFFFVKFQSLVDMPFVIQFIVAGLGAFFASKLAEVVIDKALPEPQNFTTEDLKDLINSKVFWLAILNLVTVIIGGLFNIEIDQQTQIEIVNLDWSNIGQALVSLVLIALRKVEIFKKIK